jgi:hypothetical protein
VAPDAQGSIAGQEPRSTTGYEEPTMRDLDGVELGEVEGTRAGGF